MRLALALSALLLVGCTSQAEIQQKNKDHLATNGDSIGTLPDGRRVKRYQIDNGIAEDHWVYVVDSGEVTVNKTTTIQHGDGNSTTTNHAFVTINGQVYVPKDDSKPQE